MIKSLRIFNFFYLLIQVISFAGYLYVSFFNEIEDYSYLGLLPLAFFLLFTILIKHVLRNEQISVFIIVFILICFLRYVILPIMMVYANYEGGRSPNSPSGNSFDIAFLLMLYELTVAFIAIRFFEKRLSASVINEEKLKLRLGIKNNLIFILFFVLVIGFLALNQDWLYLVSIFKVNPAAQFHAGEPSFNALFGSFLIILCKQILFLFGFYYLQLKYNENKSKVFILLAFLLIALNIGIFVGTNRSDVLISSLLSIILLFYYFPGRTIKLFALFFAIGIFTLISQITKARNFASYSGGTSIAIDRTDFLQAYLGGPYNVAIALEMKEDYPESSDLEVLFFDIFRPMLGVNLLVKNMDIEYSNIFFNRRLFANQFQRSQIIPMIGQGNLFFGYFFSPIFMLLFISLAYKFIHIALKSKNILLFYFFSLSAIRFGFMMGQNTMNMINDLSYNIFLFLIIYYLNNKIQFNND